MATLTPQERLQPSLLDRLTDEEPEANSETLDRRVLSKQQLRQAVLRDLSWLFNANNQEPPPRCDDEQRLRLWSELTEVRQSVYNFGMPALSGVTVSVIEFPRIELAIRQAILRYEPRIDAKSLEVKIVNDLTTGLRPTNLRVVIRGLLWNQPVPLELLLAADVDVDTGQAAVRDLRH